MNYNNVYQGQLLVAVNPYLTLNGDFYHVHVGLRLDFKTGDNVGFYPDVLGSVFVLDNMLEFYAKLGGRTKINTFADIIAENPFVTTCYTSFGEFGYEKTKFDFQGGAKAKIANNIDAHIGVRYHTIKNSVFYAPDYDFYATHDEDATVYHLQAFDLIFNDYNVVNFLADIHWKAMEKLDVAAELSINSYTMKPQSLILQQVPEVTDLYYKPMYKPSFTMTVRGDYQYDETWKFNAAMTFVGKRWAMTNDKQTVLLKPAFDFQLGADYKIMEDLSAFAEIHNLFHQKYQLYYNYPSVGFEIFAGIKYRF